MFTQCSKCETVFRLSAEALRAAGGQVRCGRCGEVFNALARLAEDAAGFKTGESPLDLETRAAEILESTDTHEALADAPSESAEEIGAPLSDAPPGVEIAQLQIMDPLHDDFAAEMSLEFTLPPGELDRIFVESRRNPLQQLAAEAPRGERDDPRHVQPVPSPGSKPDAKPSTGHSGTANLDDSGGDASRLGDAERDTSTSGDARPDEPQSAVPAAATDRNVVADRRIASGHTGNASDRGGGPDRATSERKVVPLTRIVGLEVSEDVRQEMLASYSHAELPEINPPLRRLPFAAWVGAAVVLAVLLATQLVRGNGEWLAAHTPLLRGSTPAAELAAYQLRQWGVTGDPGAKGTLRMRASIMNTAAQLQPYPLLRVTLANRFGTRVGAREFEPSEYLGHAAARMLAPGERIDATLDILDPGKDAEGFEIDVCLRGSDGKIVCAGDVAAQSK